MARSRGLFGAGPVQSQPPDPDPIVIPTRWGFYGDSQTGGRATETPTAVNHQTAFRNIWDGSGLTAPLSTIQNGVSGRSLAGTRAEYEGNTYASTPWLHVQESGDQNEDGQRTASEFGATFQSFMEKLRTDHPSALITYETAFSFGREAESYRNWTNYNTEMLARVATLQAAGNTVHVVDTDKYIKLLQSASGVTPADVWYQNGDSNAYHFTGVGNFCIACAMFKTLGYDLDALTYSGVSINATMRTTAVQIVRDN